jgi:NAD(P)H-hydrate epimerase
MSAEPHSRHLYTVAQVRMIERGALATMRISGYELMRRAASAALNSLRRHWPLVRQLRV